MVSSAINYERLYDYRFRDVDQTSRQAFRVIKKNFEDMLGCKLLVAFAQRERLRRLDKTAGAVSIFFEIHCKTPSACSIRPTARLKHRPQGAFKRAHRCRSRLAIRTKDM